MKIRDLIPYVHEYVYVYGDAVRKSSIGTYVINVEAGIPTNQLIWSGYLYDNIPDNIANLNVKQLSVYHERPQYMELDNCDIGIEIYIEEE